MSINTPTKVRRFERQPKTVPINLVMNGARKTDSNAFTLDISPRGASVRTKLALVPGELLGVVPKGERWLSIPARTIWVREDECKWTFAGLEFLDSMEV